ncbi:hypothetical protein GCM10022419_116840 [Nonomuraea rosea]|uniref:Uncharacterized protein n=1 Tax=Nonomuraea rosea TaxID=638574 RepID=A0ABP6ZK69_9ACTN
MVAERVVSPVFVGRGEELAALDTAVEQGAAVAVQDVAAFLPELHDLLDTIPRDLAQFMEIAEAQPPRV